MTKFRPLAEQLRLRPRFDKIEAGPGWTLEQVKTARRMWLGKYTGTQISRAVGKTRNAVMGKMWRMDREEST